MAGAIDLQMMQCTICIANRLVLEINAKRAGITTVRRLEVIRSLPGQVTLAYGREYFHSKRDQDAILFQCISDF